MNKLCVKNDLYFALLWIVIYCAVTAPLREAFGDDSLWIVGELLIVALILTLFVKRNHLAEKIGLRPFPKDGKRYLYFIPMWFLATGNLWGAWNRSTPGGISLWPFRPCSSSATWKNLFSRSAVFGHALAIRRSKGHHYFVNYLRHWPHCKFTYRAIGSGDLYSSDLCRRLGIYLDHGRLSFEKSLASHRRPRAGGRILRLLSGASGAEPVGHVDLSFGDHRRGPRVLQLFEQIKAPRTMG